MIPLKIINSIDIHNHKHSLQLIHKKIFSHILSFNNPDKKIITTIFKDREVLIQKTILECKKLLTSVNKKIKIAKKHLELLHKCIYLFIIYYSLIIINLSKILLNAK